MKKQITTQKAPAAIGPYSQAVSVGGMLYTSGQLPIDPVSGEMADGIEAQTKMSLQNIKGILEECGVGMEAVIKTTVFLQNMGDFAKMNEIYAQFFVEPYPARSCVEVAALPKGALVEIECVAELG